MKKIFGMLALACCAAITATAQNNVGINNPSPDASAALMVDTTAAGPSGILVPRMRMLRRNAIANPATGLMIYQTDNTPGYYYYNGTAWAQVGGAANAGPGLQLYAASTLAQTRNIYAYSRYTFNFDNVSSSSMASAAWTGSNTFTVPAGMGGLYQINLGVVTTGYSGFGTCPAIYPEIQVTSGATTRYVYGTASPTSTLLAGDNTDATSLVAASAGQPPLTYGRGAASTILALVPGDVLKIFIRANMSSTTSTYTVSFSTDGSSYLSIVKLN